METGEDEIVELVEWGRSPKDIVLCQERRVVQSVEKRQKEETRATIR
jgi:hypothetical protein